MAKIDYQTISSSGDGDYPKTLFWLCPIYNSLFSLLPCPRVRKFGALASNACSLPVVKSICYLRNPGLGTYGAGTSHAAKLNSMDRIDLAKLSFTCIKFIAHFVLINNKQWIYLRGIGRKDIKYWQISHFHADTASFCITPTLSQTRSPQKLSI